MGGSRQLPASTAVRNAIHDGVQTGTENGRPVTKGEHLPGVLRRPALQSTLQERAARARSRDTSPNRQAV